MRTTVRYDKAPQGRINGSTDAIRLLESNFRRKDHEEVWVLYTNSAGCPLMKRLSTIGTLKMTPIDIRRIVRDALNCNATGVIIAHNHPSGDVRPGKSDIDNTDKLHRACNVFDICLLDHLIVGNGNYYSFSDDAVHSFTS